MSFWSKIAFLMVQRSRTMRFMFPIAVCELTDCIINWHDCRCYRCWIVSLWYRI